MVVTAWLPTCETGNMAGAHGHVAEVDGAGAALGDAAAVLGADEVEVVTQHPKHGRGGVNVPSVLPLMLRFAIMVKYVKKKTKKKKKMKIGKF